MSGNNGREKGYDFIDRNDQQMHFPVEGKTFFTFAELWKPTGFSREHPLLRRITISTTAYIFTSAVKSALVLGGILEPSSQISN
jgi:hypothetical protein